jgi:hypothetical protein
LVLWFLLLYYWRSFNKNARQFEGEVESFSSLSSLSSKS